MDFSEYQTLALRTRNEKADVVYAASKMMIEATEVVDIIPGDDSAIALVMLASRVADKVIKNHYHLKNVDRDALLLELGDVLWNLTALAADYGFTLGDVARANVEKLNARHGEKYNPNYYTG